MLEGALRVRQGQPLYPAPSGLPIVIHVYGPIAYAVEALALGHGLSFLGGRVLVLLCSLAISVLISTLLCHRTHSVPVALAFGLVLLTIPAFRFWLYLLRADLIGIVFLLAGLSLYALKPRYLLWSTPFFSAALFCKYSLVAAPIALILHLCLRRQYKIAMRFAMLLATLCGVAFWLLQVNSSGGFAFHMLSTHYDTYRFAQFFGLMGLVWLSAPVITGLALFHVEQSFSLTDPDLATLYFLVACVTSLTAGKLGSTTNHFLEWMVAACLCAGMGYARMEADRPRFLSPLALALSISILVSAGLQTRAALRPDPELSGCVGAYEYVLNSKSSRVLSQSLGLLLLTGKPVILTDPFAYGQLVRHRVLSDGSLMHAIDERYFDLIVTSVDPENAGSRGSDIWPPSLLQAMGRQYHLVKRFDCRDGSVMLEPRP